MVEHPGLFLSQDDDAPRAIGEPFEHRTPSHSPADRSGTRIVPDPAAAFRSGTRVVEWNQVPRPHSTL
ncbi:hypothetical protein YT1_0837 [Rhodococcus ruber]|nr:hypothetical protein YT1_0837 [Rhodococcus ruber]